VRITLLDDYQAAAAIHDDQYPMQYLNRAA
jgi:hypothetical protein